MSIDCHHSGWGFSESCYEKLWYFRYYVLRLWILFNFSVLYGLVLHGFVRERGKIPFYCQGWIEAKSLHFSTIDTWWGSGFLLLPGRGELWHPMEHIWGREGIGRWKGSFQPVGLKILSLYLLFSDITLTWGGEIGIPHCSLERMNARLSTPSLLDWVLVGPKFMFLCYLAGVEQLLSKCFLSC